MHRAEAPDSLEGDFGKPACDFLPDFSEPL